MTSLKNTRILVIALALAASSLWAQGPESQSAQDPQVPLQAQSAPPASTQTEPPAAAEPTTPPEAQPQFQERSQQANPVSTEPEIGARNERTTAPDTDRIRIAVGDIVATTDDQLVLATDAGNRMAFKVDDETLKPKDLKNGDRATVEFITLPDGTLHASKVTVAAAQSSTAPPVVPIPTAVNETPPTPPPAPAIPAPVKARTTSKPAATPKVASSPTPAPTAAKPRAGALFGARNVSAASSSTAATSTDGASELAVASTAPAASGAIRVPPTSKSTPWGNALPFVVAAAGLAFLTVLAVRQARGGDESSSFHLPLR